MISTEEVIDKYLQLPGWLCFLLLVLLEPLLFESVCHVHLLDVEEELGVVGGGEGASGAFTDICRLTRHRLRQVVALLPVLNVVLGQRASFVQVSRHSLLRYLRKTKF